MSTILNYTLSLTDQMSAKLQKIGISSSTSLNIFAKLEQQTKEVNRIMKSTGGSVGALRGKLDLLRKERDWIPQKNITQIRKYNTEIKRLEKRITRFETINGSRTKRWFSEAFNQVPFGHLLMNPLVIAGAVAGGAIRLGVEEEMQKATFEVLLGGKEAAAGLDKDIVDYANKSPYKRLGLRDAAKTMLGFGVAQEKILPAMKAIGDIAGGNKGRFDSLNLAYAQSQSASKLMGQDLLQMVNAGFNPLMQMSKDSGKSISVLRKEMESGNITSKDVETSFINATKAGGMFHGMADKMSKTLGGRLSNMMDKVEHKLLQIYGAIEPVASALLDLTNYGIDKVSEGIGFLVTKFKEGNWILMLAVGAVGTLLTAMSLLKVSTMAQALWTAALTLANNLQTASWWSLNAAMLANPITWIIAGVVALVGAVAYLIYKVDGWGEAWTNTVSVAKSTWNMFTSFLKLNWLAVEHIFLSGIEKIMQSWYKLKSLWDAEGAQKGLDKIKQASDKRKQGLVEEGLLMQKNALDAIRISKKGFGLTINDKSFSDVKSEIASKLGIAPTKGADGKEVTTNLSTTNNNKNNKSNTATATGGTKHNYITISIKSIIEALHIKGNDFNETATQLQEKTTDALLRTLALASSSGN